MNLKYPNPMNKSLKQNDETGDLEPFLQEVSIDETVNQIGFGKFHLKILLLFALLSFQQTAQCSVPGIILPSLRKEFNLSKGETSIFGTMEYLGFLFASLFLGIFSNRFGRRNGILYSQITFFASSFLTLFAPNIYVFSLLRCVVSTSFMLMFFCGYSLISEVWPQKTRGLVMNSLVLWVLFGFMMVAFFGSLLLPDIENSDWRPLLILYLLILVTSFVLNFFFIEESPRYDLFLGKKARAFATIKKMAELNLGQKDFLTDQKKQQIEVWVDNFNKKIHEALEIRQGESGFLHEYRKLFKGPYKLITITMFILWTTTSSNLFGMEFVLPTTLSKIMEGSDFHPLRTLFFINLSIFPFLIPFVIMVEMQYFGRKKTLTIIYFAMAVGGFLTYFFGSIVYLCCFKLCIHLSFVLVYLFTAELYPTHIRTNAIGQSSAFSRIGSMIIIWVTVFLVEIQPFLPFFVYAIFGLVAFLAILKLPYETLNEDLDRIISKD